MRKHAHAKFLNWKWLVAGIEPATPCLQSGKPNLSNLAGADTTRLKLATSSKTRQAVFLPFVRFLLAI
jgi:hypothetical protein